MQQKWPYPILALIWNQVVSLSGFIYVNKNISRIYLAAIKLYDKTGLPGPCWREGGTPVPPEIILLLADELSVGYFDCVRVSWMCSMQIERLIRQTWNLYTVRPMFLSRLLCNSSCDIRGASKVDTKTNVAIALAQYISNVKVILAELVVGCSHVGAAEFDGSKCVQALEK